MNLLKKMFASWPPRKLCVRTYELFLEGITDDQIFERLCAEGCSAASASRAVTFVPSAFARVYYVKDGIVFPESFYPGRSAYKNGQMRAHIDEPIFSEALSLAEQIKRDDNWGQALRVVEISAEHKVIQEGKSRGLVPKITLLIHEF
jgi:hypothetical protein